jgi:hypothetical protein
MVFANEMDNNHISDSGHLSYDVLLTIYSYDTYYVVKIIDEEPSKDKSTHPQIIEINVSKIKDSNFGSSAFTNSGCGYNKKMDPMILGLYDNNSLDKSGDYFTKVIKAWRIDRKNFKFIEISTKDMYCKFQWVPGTY